MIIFNVWIIVIQNPDMVLMDDERLVPDNHDDSREVAVCPDCGWMKKYPTLAQSKQALGAHRRFCKGKSAKKARLQNLLDNYGLAVWLSSYHIAAPYTTGIFERWNSGC